MNQIIRSLMSRKSVRSFKDREIPEDIIQVILEASTQAPTAGNQQLYTILLYRRYHGEHRRAERYPWSASICVPCGNARLRISHRAAGSPQKAGAGRYEIHRPWKQLPCVICRRTEGHAFLSFWGAGSDNILTTFCTSMTRKLPSYPLTRTLTIPMWGTSSIS